MKKSESLLLMWAVAGVVLGLSLGVLLNSVVVGIPVGLSVSFLAAVVVDRVSPYIARLVK